MAFHLRGESEHDRAIVLIAYCATGGYEAEAIRREVCLDIIPFSCQAQHRTWQRAGPTAMDGGADVLVLGVLGSAGAFCESICWRVES